MYDVGIVGCGPAGIFTALELLKANPNLKIIMLDKGKNIKTRGCPKKQTIKCIECQPCSISSGFGGAGAFSDGKLSLSKDVGGWLEDYVGEEKLNELIDYVDKVYIEYGGTKKISYNQKFAEQMEYDCSKVGLRFVKCPIRHLGTEKSAAIMDRMYDYLLSFKNVTILTLKETIDVDFKNKVIITKDNRYPCENIVLAVGRSGSEWLYNKCKENKIKSVNNQVDIGVRVELPRSITDALTDQLYEFKIYNTSKTTENVVRTFCMNPGGFVTQENYDDNLACVNGHSFKNEKSNLTNFALLVSAHFTDPFDKPIEYGKYIARLSNMLTGGKIMVQRLCDLKEGKRSTANRIKKLTYTPTLADAVPGDLSFALPGRILNAILETFDELEKICPGISGKDTILYGVEVKFYSSKIIVNNNLETASKGIYAIGDGAGITRGLMQASISGVIAARDILKKQD
ncbi:MAG: FAD-dependent oxidoreductase [Bacilli bacterium]|nr:FAD-dependent oxidoreductase [Bacilli bacterium]MDD4733344.1 FAD-dependent oxidoreductase [Bacilli bacterium]